jgi:glycerophosphoryl diester phosphodiesterase
MCTRQRSGSGDALIVAHRGDVTVAPENTMPAFESAIAKGADAIEFDVHLTKDGVLVIHHDHYLGRTVPEAGHIGSYSLSELQEFDAGSWFGPEYAGTTIPTLIDVLSLKNHSVRFEVELCTPSLVCLQKVVETIAKLGLEEHVELTSFHTPLLCKSAETYPHLRTGLFFSQFPDWMQTAHKREHILSWLDLSGARVAHLPLNMIDESLVNQIRERNLLVHGADLNSEIEISEGIALKIDQFSTDNLDLALSIRRDTLR